MGVAVAPSNNAPPDRSHAVSLNNAEGTSVCGSTVEQGQELTIEVDATLAALVSDDGWSQGLGPNYIVEATNSYLQETAETATQERGCANTRVVNPGASSTVFPLQAGEMVVRLMAAYSFGQVWASEECVVTVTGSRTVAQHAGYLVDNASWEGADDALKSMPYELSVEGLVSGAASGYSVLENLEDGSFAVKYAIDEADAGQVTTLLESLSSETMDVQVSISGFESEDGSTVDLISLSQCTSSATCDGFFSVPTDLTCIAEGICIESSVVDEAAGTLTTIIVTSDDSWFGIGFTTPGGGMNGGGAGSDIFACSAEGLRRFLVTERDNPGTSASSTETIVEDAEDAEIVKNLCVLDTEAGTGRMTFTRDLDGVRPIVPGQAQAIIYARGPLGLQTLTSPHPSGRRGEVSLDLTDVSGGVTTTKQTAPAILWLHIICMSLSWGLCLPLAVVIAALTRSIGPRGTWFSYHKTLARVGWTLQTMGAIFGAYYAEVYSDHLQFAHTKLGLFVVIAGFLQPLSALVRPHPPKGGWPGGEKPAGRTLFELYHRGVGWTAVICGMVNVFLGAKLVMDLSFKDVTKNVPISIGSIGVALFFVVAGWSMTQEKTVVEEEATPPKSQNSLDLAAQ